MVVYYKRENKKGTCYQAVIRIKGYKTLYKTFKLKSEAQDWAEPIEISMKKGKYREAAPCVKTDDAREKIVLITELIEYFEKYVAIDKYSDPEKYTCMYKWWKDKIGIIKVKELTSALLSSCKQYLKTEKIIKGKNKETGEPIYTIRSNSTINKYLMCLSAVLKYAVNELEIIETNPMSKVDTLPKPDGRTRFLTDEEIPKLIESCKKQSEPDATLLFFLILLSTGGRYSEVLHLMVENIDFRNNRLLFLNTKNKTNRGVGIDTRLINLIKQYIEDKNIKNGYIFINKKTNKLLYMRGYLQDAIKKAEIENFHIHDTRHTTGSTLARNGASLLDIAIILGHKTLAMAPTYSHLTEQHTDKVLKEAVNTLPLGDDLF